MVEPRFPHWAFETEMAAIPVAFVFLGLLLRRLRLVHPATWEKLGRPSLFVSPWTGSVIALSEAFGANIRLLVFPFRSESFQLTDLGTVILLWLVRLILMLSAMLGLWSWWAIH